MKRSKTTGFKLALFGAAILIASVASVGAQNAPTKPMDRTVLPILEPKRPLYKELDARNVKPPPRFEVTLAFQSAARRIGSRSGGS